MNFSETFVGIPSPTPHDLIKQCKHLAFLTHQYGSKKGERQPKTINCYRYIYKIYSNTYELHLEPQPNMGNLAKASTDLQETYCVYNI